MAAAIADGVPVSRLADNSGVMLPEQASERCFPASGDMTVAMSTVNPDGTESVATRRADSAGE
ncbi:hypothetical protein Misp05_29640 [Micromonospora sp. NBRC 107095]|nr:hypothetical protein Misp05_29640 [Micromonospora sp. NBRC 107095]